MSKRTRRARSRQHPHKIDRTKHHKPDRPETHKTDRPQQSKRPTANTGPILPTWKKAVFALAILIALPLVAEGVLWIAGTETLLQREDPFRGFSGLVSVFERDGDTYRTRRISGPKTFNDQSFAARKPKNGLRIFCLGGSSSYGFPWGSQVAFTAILGDALAAARPDLTVEAVNASGVSYAMHRLRILASELVRYQPDIFIIYSGHNEFIERSFFENLEKQSAERNRIQYALGHSRTYTVLRDLVRGNDKEQSEAQGFEAFVRRDESRTYDAAEKQKIVDTYRAQLTSLIELAKSHEVKVLLATVPCNLADWKPNKSTISESLTDAQQRDWAAEFRAGKTAVSNEQFDDAVQHLTRAHDLAPSHAETDYWLGKALAGIGKYAEARAAFDRACDHDVSPIRRISAINDVIRDVARKQNVLLMDVEKTFRDLSPDGLLGFNLIEDYVHPTRKSHEIIAWNLLSAMSHAGWLGKPSSLSRTQFDAIAARRDVGAKRNATWYFNQAYMLQHEGRIEEAIAKYGEALAASPTHAQALANMAPLLFSIGRLRESEDAFNRLFELDPHNIGAHISYGSILASMNRYAEAASQYREAIKDDPKRTAAQLGLARCLVGMGSRDEAGSIYRQVLQTEPTNDDALVSLGELLEEESRAIEAQALYRRAVQANPDSVMAHCALAEAVWNAGQKAEANELLQTAEALVLDDTSQHFDLGTAFLKTGQYEKAIEHIEVVLRGNPQHVKANERMALALWKLKRIDEAVVHLQRIVDVRPDSATALQNLATGLLELGRTTEAVEEFKAALAIREDLAKSHAGLASAFMSQGRIRDAITHMQRAVQLEPDNTEYRARLKAISQGNP